MLFRPLLRHPAFAFLFTLVAVQARAEVPPFSAVQPLLKEYCLGCHSTESASAAWRPS
jgi:hypothetical protein